MKVDNVIGEVKSCGRGACGKVWFGECILHCLCLHSDDHCLLGIKLQGNYFTNLVLPFGLGSALFIFSSIAEPLGWALGHGYGVRFLLHYLDNFHKLGSTQLTCLLEQSGHLHSAFEDWGIPLTKIDWEGHLLAWQCLVLGWVGLLFRLVFCGAGLGASYCC